MCIVSKRLAKEIPHITRKYGAISIIPNEYKFNRVVKLKNIKLKLDDNYPFKPPCVFVNDRNYINLLATVPLYVQEELRNIGIHCLCCKSIICAARWNPAIKLIDIIDEYFDNKKLINKFINKKYIRLVCESKRINCPIIINKMISYL